MVRREGDDISDMDEEHLQSLIAPAGVRLTSAHLRAPAGPRRVPPRSISWRLARAGVVLSVLCAALVLLATGWSVLCSLAAVRRFAPALSELRADVPLDYCAGGELCGRVVLVDGLAGLPHPRPGGERAAGWGRWDDGHHGALASVSGGCPGGVDERGACRTWAGGAGGPGAPEHGTAHGRAPFHPHPYTPHASAAFAPSSRSRRRSPTSYFPLSLLYWIPFSRFVLGPPPTSSAAQAAAADVEALAALPRALPPGERYDLAVCLVVRPAGKDAARAGREGGGGTRAGGAKIGGEGGVVFTEEWADPGRPAGEVGTWGAGTQAPLGAQGPWGAQTQWSAQGPGPAQGQWSAQGPGPAQGQWSAQGPGPAQGQWSAQGPGPAQGQWSAQGPGPAQGRWSEQGTPGNRGPAAWGPADTSSRAGDSRTHRQGQPGQSAAGAGTGPGDQSGTSGGSYGAGGTQGGAYGQTGSEGNGYGPSGPQGNGYGTYGPQGSGYGPYGPHGGGCSYGNGCPNPSWYSSGFPNGPNGYPNQGYPGGNPVNPGAAAGYPHPSVIRLSTVPASSSGYSSSDAETSSSSGSPHAAPVSAARVRARLVGVDGASLASASRAARLLKDRSGLARLAKRVAAFVGLVSEDDRVDIPMLGPYRERLEAPAVAVDVAIAAPQGGGPGVDVVRAEIRLAARMGLLRRMLWLAKPGALASVAALLLGVGAIGAGIATVVFAFVLNAILR